MLRYFIKRLLGMIPTLIIVAVCVFFFIHLLPGDPARLAAGPEADEATVEMIRHSLGLDRSIPEQFVNFVVGACQGDFGTSIRSQRPVIQEIGERFGPTLWLTLTSMVWSVIFGLVIGVISAVYRNKWPDRIGMTLAVSGISFPAFALGILLMEIFSVELGWLPTVGASSWKHYILPSITLGAAVAAVMARFTRASFVEVLHDDYIRTARAKGLSEHKVIYHHAFRNTLIPLVTFIGGSLPGLFAGALITETLFAIPGIGFISYNAMVAGDIPFSMFYMTFLAILTLLGNLISDILYAVVDPRVRIA